MKFAITKIAGLIFAIAATGAQAAPVSMTGVLNVASKAGHDLGNSLQYFIPIYVDSTLSGFVDQAAGTWGVSSTTPFYGLNWTASGGRLITSPGTYALDTASDAIYSAASSPPTASDGVIHFTIGAGQIAGAINWAWGATTNVRIVNVWNVSPSGYSFEPSLIVAAVPSMENGPFPGFNFAFNLAPVPEASTYAMMLVGLGLVGGVVSRRRRMQAIGAAD